MRRNAIGILALLLLIGALIGLAAYGVRDSEATVVSAMCLRIGLVLGAIWLAFPQLIQWSGKTSPWMVALLCVVGVMLVARPRMIAVLGPVLLILGALSFAGWLMKPLK